MKHALIAASLVLVAGSAVGCGGKDDGGKAAAPAAASEKTFCANFKSIGEDLGKLGADAKDSEIVKALKGAGQKIEDTGTPKGISADARKGFELTVKLIKDLPDDASQKDVGQIDKDLSDSETKQEQAFNKYVTDTCQA